MSTMRAEVFDLQEPDRAVVALINSEHSSVSIRVGDENGGAPGRCEPGGPSTAP